MHDSWPREPQGRELENLTQLFKVLGDPSRMKVLFQIGSSEACVTEVAARLNMSESAVSHHIHILRMNGLVRWRRSGKTILYQMNDDHVTAAFFCPKPAGNYCPAMAGYTVHREASGGQRFFVYCALRKFTFQY